MSDLRRTLITGTSRGLGRALAEHLLAQGDRVVGCARGETAIQHERYTHLQADVTDPADVRRVFQQVRQTLRGLDVLINNAGVGRMLPVALTPADTAQRMMDVNFLAAFQMTHGAIRLLRDSPAGRIVNMTTVAVPLRLEGEAIYAAAKAALEMFTRILAKEVGPLGITCNAVGPSPIRTDLIRNVPEDKLQALIDRQAVRQWAEPRDVVHVVDFYLSPASRMITGQVIYLGGIG
ncbi:SDR family NAD(P)-dependent oxidoreductase [Desulfonatronum thioautotrophicum]|uniref:SDR family NAD(P)-dependent oxidoreductase n=1 Tax=Desulfonatronum thioautotrophicum TaxID=617001 RepID=UPI0005EB2A56|nr:SDR family oxidoreductase [Desulfonatronum thioautotrophicum]